MLVQGDFSFLSTNMQPSPLVVLFSRNVLNVTHHPPLAEYILPRGMMRQGRSLFFYGFVISEVSAFTQPSLYKEVYIL